MLLLFLAAVFASKVRHRPYHLSGAVEIPSNNRRGISDFRIQIVSDLVNGQDITNAFASMLDVTKRYEPQQFPLCGGNGTKVWTTGDLLIHIGNGTRCGKDDLAYQITCERAPNKRPISAFIGLCGPVNDTILHHEILHAMGFESESFLMTRNLGMQNHNGYMRFVGKKTVDAARRYFNCPSFGGLWIDGDHLAQLYDDELMTPFYRANVEKPTFSEFTMTILQDLGWYQPKVRGREAKFGWRCGCEFVKNKCSAWHSMLATEDPFYCFDDGPNCIVYNYTSRIAAPLFNNSYIAGIPSQEYCGIKRDYPINYMKTPSLLPVKTFFQTKIGKWLASILRE